MSSTWKVENYIKEEEFELLRMTFVFEYGIPTCIEEVKVELDGRTPEETAEQLGRMLNNFEMRGKPVEQPPPMDLVRQSTPVAVPKWQLRRSSRRQKPRVCS